MIFTYVKNNIPLPSYDVQFEGQHYGRIVHINFWYRYYPDSSLAPNRGFSADALKEIAAEVDQLNIKTNGMSHL